MGTSDAIETLCQNTNAGRWLDLAGSRRHQILFLAKPLTANGIRQRFTPERHGGTEFAKAPHGNAMYPPNPKSNQITKV